MKWRLRGYVAYSIQVTQFLAEKRKTLFHSHHLVEFPI